MISVTSVRATEKGARCQSLTGCIHCRFGVDELLSSVLSSASLVAMDEDPLLSRPAVEGAGHRCYRVQGLRVEAVRQTQNGQLGGEISAADTELSLDCSNSTGGGVTEAWH